MRVIGGKHKRAALIGPPADSGALRPTSDRVRENVFNLLSGRVPGASFLDLFAGTGAVGIEALSRGARRVTFVEQQPLSLKVIRQNIEKLGIGADCSVARADAVVFSAAKSAPGAPFDVVYIDPPYAAGVLPEVLRNLAAGPLLAENAVVVAEQREKPADENFGRLVRTDARRYGKTWVVILRPAPDDGGSQTES